MENNDTQRRTLLQIAQEMRPDLKPDDIMRVYCPGGLLQQTISIGCLQGTPVKCTECWNRPEPKAIELARVGHQSMTDAEIIAKYCPNHVLPSHSVINDLRCDNDNCAECWENSVTITAPMPYVMKERKDTNE